MPKTLLHLNSASGGEVSPKLDARVDQEKYTTWSRQQRNVIAYRTGGFTRAPGTLQMSPAKLPASDLNNYCVRLVEFKFSSTTTFMLEFGHQYIRFYSNKQQVQVSGVPLEVISPYSANAGTGSIYDTDVFGIAFKQINDVVYITSPNYPPYKLSRIADTIWTMRQVNFYIPPLMDLNASGVFMQVSALTGNGVTVAMNAPTWVTATIYNVGDSVNTGNVLYTCLVTHTSGSFTVDYLSLGYWKVEVMFQPGHIGSTWQISHPAGSSYVTQPISANGTSSTLSAIGNVTFNTYGVWNADVLFQTSTDGGSTWTTIRTITSRLDNQSAVAGGGAVTYSVTLAKQTSLRIVVQNYTAMGGATTPRATIVSESQIVSGLFTITAMSGSVNPNGAYFACIANIVKAVYSTNNSLLWNEGAWSNLRGFPAAITGFQQRMWYAATFFQPQRFWGTVTNDLENMDRSNPTLATASVVFDLNAPGRGPIRWLTSQTDLYAGLDGAEWVINSGQTSTFATASGAAITPTAINAVEQGSYGSTAKIAPVIVGNSVFFVQRQADSARQMGFQFSSQKYTSQDLCALADHLFTSRIAQISYQTRWRHQGLFWALTKQGTLCGLTYDVDGEVGGWCRRDTGIGQTDPTTGGAITPDSGFESIATIPGATGEDDQVWVVANRLINGKNVRFIELVNPVNWEENFPAAPAAPAPLVSQAYYVDCGVIVSNPGSLTFTNSFLANIIGRYVVGLADGVVFGPIRVTAGGSVTLPAVFPTTVGTVVIGLPISYVAQPMRIDAVAGGGNTQGLNKSISDIYLRLMNSLGGSISNGSVNYPVWLSTVAYTAGQNVLSGADQQSYQCIVAIMGGADPSANPTNWTPIPFPSYQQPVPISYTALGASPFAVPVMVTTPTDKRITPQNQPVPGHDPKFLVVGNDAAPITVLGYSIKYSIDSTA